MKIQDLKPSKKARRSKKRKGRGIGCGHGKTSGRGHKGQQARSGKGKQSQAAEGGQMPLARRMPKVGFTSLNRVKYHIVNLIKLNIFEQGTDVTPAMLQDKGLIKNQRFLVKILGKGELKKNLNVSAGAFSVSAKEAIEKAGGSIKILKKATLDKNVKGRS